MQRVILLGLCKSGTTSFDMLFKAMKLRTAHHRITLDGKGMYVRDVIEGNIKAGRPPLDRLPMCVTQMDAVSKDCCGFPQIDHIDALLSAYPDALYIHNWRPVEKVVASFDKWGTLTARFALYGHQYLDGKGEVGSQISRFALDAQRRTRAALRASGVTWIDFEVGKDSLKKLGRHFDIGNRSVLPKRNAAPSSTHMFPSGIAIGGRPKEHTPDCFGTLEEPWIARQAIHYIKLYLEDRKTPRVLEYGCGSSTAWFLKMGATVTSIEHHSGWLDSVHRKLESADPALLSRWTPVHVAAAARGTQLGGDGQYYDDYVARGEELGAFDMIVVDGRCRSGCLRASIPNVALGGLLVLDNSERERYQSAIGECVPSHWEEYRFRNAKTETTIWRCVRK